MCTICNAFRPADDDCAYEAIQGDLSGANITEETNAPSSVSTTYEMSVGDTFEGTISASDTSDWIRIDLDPGDFIRIDMTAADTGHGTLSDPMLYLFDANGNYLTGNDDGGNGFESLLTFGTQSGGTFYIGADAFGLETGSYRVTVTAAQAAPEGTIDDFADQLIDGYWEFAGVSSRQWNVSAGGEITVDITNISAAGQQMARWALESWSNVTGITFREVSSGADIEFEEPQTSSLIAQAGGPASGGFYNSATVTISSGWIAEFGTTIDSYSFQTFIHEVGHALGLGHAGDYNGSASYGTDETFQNDSWQMTVMSYFSQTDNTLLDADFARLVTPMIADIVAMHEMYGVPTAGAIAYQEGNTTWGANSNVGGYLGQLFGQVFGEDAADSSIYTGDAPIAMTIWDTGGKDTVDLSPSTFAQKIDLREEAVSDIMGTEGNLIIARGTTIENAIGGAAKDRIIGNGANNKLEGQGGNDTLEGKAGRDTLIGGNGKDKLIGDGGNDTLKGGNGKDTLEGDDGKDTLEGGKKGDTLKGGAGNDTIEGGTGNDKMWGNGGRDTFLFEFGNAGNDTIKGFNAGDDTLAFEGGSKGQISVNKQGGDTYVRHGGDEIKLEGVSLSKSEIDFDFV